MEQWNGKHRAFAVKVYISGGFSLRGIHDGPLVNLIQSWVAKFRAAESTFLQFRSSRTELPYKNQTVQDLVDSDFALRRTYAKVKFLTFPTDAWMGNIFFSDEAHLHIYSTKFIYEIIERAEREKVSF